MWPAARTPLPTVLTHIRTQRAQGSGHFGYESIHRSPLSLSGPLWKPDAGGMCVSLICVNFTLNSLYYDDVLSLFSLLFVGFSIFQNCRPSELYQVRLSFAINGC